MNEELYFKDCFTEVEKGKINSEFNKVTLKCFDSENQTFSMDCEGNLVVNSIITREVNNLDMTNIVELIYPVGSFYFTSSNINPTTLFGGTWRQIKDRFLLSCGDKYENGSVGGEDEHQLTIEELPSHNHSIFRGTEGTDYYGITGKEPTSSCPYENKTTSTGNNQPHNNMPPYLAVYVWERIS